MREAVARALPDLRPAEPPGHLKIRVPYTPRVQFREYHRRTQRFALTVAHRRAGKTVAEVNEAVKKILTCQRTFPVPQVAFISPTFGQGKRNAWPYAKHYTSSIPGMKVMEGDLTLVFPTGAKYIFAGSDNYESLRGLYLDHASLDEHGSQDPRVWPEVVRPALADYKGSATFIGSARGRNHFYDLMINHADDPDWLITILKASETGILSQEELADARKTMTAEQYRQEYECDFNAAVMGTYYGAEVSLAEEEGRVTRVTYDRAADVYASWDLGLGSGMVVWVYQRVGPEWHWIDYYEGMRPDSALEEAVHWVKNRPYKIDEHFLPHDAEAKELQNAGTSRKEFLQQRNLNCTTIPRASIDDGIATVRLNFNKFWFDREKTSRGLDCLRMYQASYDEKKKVFSTKPFHNWASHPSDALRIGVTAQPINFTRSDWGKPIRRNLSIA